MLKSNKYITLLTLTLLFTINACTNRNTTPEEVNNEVQTPEVLVNDNKLDLGSVSKRYNQDIIEKLFEEAIDKDQNLKNLVTRINQVEKLKYDSLIDYNNYIQNNEKYWNAIDQYINQLTDSTLKTDMANMFDKLEKNYHTKISTHQQKVELINEKSKQLSNYNLILKLVVSKNMMDNYQKNELPSIKAINNIISKYDITINDIEKYTK